MKVNILAPCIVTTALLLTLGIVAMITNLTLEHLNNPKPVIVSYPCIVVKGDKWIRRADLEIRNIPLGKPPALPGDSQSLTVPGRISFLYKACTGF